MLHLKSFHITLNHFFKPNFQSSQTERFNDQVEICKILNNQKYYNSYVKVLPKSFFKNIIFNYYNFEVNPIYNNISDYKNLIVNSNTVVTAMKKIKPHFDKQNIIQQLEKLSIKVMDYRETRALTNLIAVEHINNGNRNYTHAFRAHILNNEIISFYVAISKSLVVSMTQLEDGDLNEFIRINLKFAELLNNDSFKKKILKAMSSITNMGAVDFLLVDDKPIFLEINPMWKGNFFEKNFGDNKILLDWFYKKPGLEKIIPNVFQFKNPIKYWGNFYTTLINQC